MLADQWFVVVANPQRENFVAEQLSELEPYLPRFKNTKGRIAALFPGYLFVPKVEHWGPISSTVGVRGLLKSGDHPACIPGRVIANWRSRERNGLVQLPPPPRFHPGERLTITRGSLKWRSVIHVGMSGKQRERVLIEMLGQHVSILVPTADLVSEFRPATRNSLRKNRETLSGQRAGRSADRSL
jgi:transcriptional antiterminator RfaH